MGEKAGYEYDEISAIIAGISLFAWDPNAAGSLGQGNFGLITKAILDAYIQALQGDVVRPSGDTINDVTLNNYTEATSVAVDTVIESDEKLIWERTLTENTTFSDGLSNGQSLTMHIYDGDTYTVTWPTMTWVGGSAPTLTSADVLTLWKTGGVLYGAYVGSIA